MDDEISSEIQELFQELISDSGIDNEIFSESGSFFCSVEAYQHDP